MLFLVLSLRVAFLSPEIWSNIVDARRERRKCRFLLWTHWVCRFSRRVTKISPGKLCTELANKQNHLNMAVFLTFAIWRYPLPVGTPHRIIKPAVVQQSNLRHTVVRVTLGLLLSHNIRYGETRRHSVNNYKRISLRKYNFDPNFFVTFRNITTYRAAHHNLKTSLNIYIYIYIYNTYFTV